jgi:hypothetical protein
VFLPIPPIVLEGVAAGAQALGGWLAAAWRWAFTSSAAPAISGGKDAFGVWRFVWAGGGYASFTTTNGRVAVDYINRGAAAAGQAGQMLAAAIRQAGVLQPKELFVSQVIQKTSSSTAVVTNVLRQAATHLGGKVTAVSQGVDAEKQWLRVTIGY